ncbi:MAG: glycosyltransferase family 1 protein [Sulfurospirillaceae bacterium]|nr:glycosyltransferase family 1 protein [Sulfurospirillaceae bacterium]
MVYIDCTSTHAINMLTGIQRVVFNVIDQMQSDPEIKKNIQPIILSNHGFVAIEGLIPHQYTHQSDKQEIQHPSLSPKTLETFKLFLRKFPIVYQVAKKAFFVFKRFSIARQITKQKINFTRNDTVLFLDATWSIPIWEEIQRAKKSQAKIIFVIYDLIPIRFSHFCDSAHREEFITFFKRTLDYADGYLGISQTVMNDVKDYVSTIEHTRSNDINYDYFYLGADFSTNTDKMHNGIRQEIVDFFNDDTPIFLTVSTIEPRKNHALILDAFNHLWDSKQNIKLCFIGKVGWKIQKFISQIRAHPMNGTQFLVIHDANDAELKYAYQHARGLIFASLAEGFGLPIIEAANYHLPVLASDIPIHKEIGRQEIDYFESNNVKALISKIREMANKPKKTVQFSWLTWEQSAHMLWNKISNKDLI